MLYRTLFTSLLIVLLAACNSGSHSPQSPPNTAIPRSLESKLQGTWEQTGYGEAVVVANNEVSLYQFTTETCVLQDVVSLDDVGLLALADDETSFLIRDSEFGFTERFDRIDNLPASCVEPIGASPTEIFAHVWHTFNEYYAFFAERNVDWLAQYDAVRDQVSDEMSDEALFISLATLIAPLDDAHVSLNAGEEAEFAPAHLKGVFGQLLDEFNNQTLIPDFDQYLSQELNRWTSIVIDTYLDDRVFTAGGPDDDMLLWGTIETDIGYLRIDRMLVSELSIDEQLAELSPILDDVFADLAGTSAMIVDLRINQGGTDPVALAIANRFADINRLGVRKFSRTSRGEGALQAIDLTPRAVNSYLQPTVVLTSATTTSAAEVFALAMREIPHVTHIGESTNGSISDALDKTLPNGWQFSLANEVYSGSDGIAYEATGIQPHIEAIVFDATARESQQDSGLNAALQWLSTNQ